MAIGAVVLLSSVIVPRWQAATEFTCYRVTMGEVSRMVRAMPGLARQQKQRAVLRVDPGSRRLVLVLVAPRREAIQRTLWLPKGLEIAETSGEPIRTDAQGALEAGTLVVEAPKFQRAFRLKTAPNGTVELHEIPST